MPSIKKKTHKGVKKRFKVTATGKVIHKRCGSSHLNSHKSGKQIRRKRKKSIIQMTAVARKLRLAVSVDSVLPPLEHETPETGAVAAAAPEAPPAPEAAPAPAAE